MPERMQALFLNPSSYQNTVVTLSEIHWPGVISMLIRYQGHVLPKNMPLFASPGSWQWLCRSMVLSVCW